MNKYVLLFRLFVFFLLLCSVVLLSVSTVKQSEKVLKVNGKTYVLSVSEFNRVFDLAVNKTRQTNHKTNGVFGPQLNQAIDKKVRQAQNNTQHYVDWHYSLLGSVLRLGENYAQKKMMLILFNANSLTEAFQSIDDLAAVYLQTSINLQQSSFVDEFLEQIQPYQIELEAEKQALLDEINLEEIYISYIRQHLASQEAQQQWASSASLGALISAAVVTRQLAAQASTKAAARSTSRLTALNVCAPAVVAGPAAIVCGGAVFIVSTVATETALLKYDKMTNGAELKAQLDQDLAAMGESIKQQHVMMFNQLLTIDENELAHQITEHIRPIDLLRTNQIRQ